MQSKGPSIVSALQHHALTAAHKPAFIFVNETLERIVLTWEQVWNYSRKFSAWLREAGLEKGDVICNCLPNSPQRLLSVFGAITAGCITMSVESYLADESDILPSLNRSRAQGLILNTSDPNGAFNSLKPSFQTYNPGTGKVSCQDVPTLKYVLHCTLGNFSTFVQSLDKYENDMLHEDLDPNDIYVYTSTSGSSGTMKLMPHNSNVLFEFADIAFGQTRDKVFMSNSDFGWLSGFPHVHHEFTSTRVLLDRGANIPEDTTELQWKVAVQEKCEICYTDPFYLKEFANVRRKSDNPEIRNYKFGTIVSGGGPITRQHVQTALKEIAVEVMIIYGTTEGGVISFKKIRNLEDFEDFNTGYPSRNTKIKVVGDDKKRVPTGQMGEILFKTSQSLLHYVNDPENTTLSFDPDGWTRLGDVGKVNDKGQVYVMGRNKFAISKSNFTLYPEVIEGSVRKCPGIADVAVTGVPDDKMFEEICALFIKQSNVQISEEDVREFCQSTLNNAMIPKYILFVDSFPRTLTEKLDRKKIQKLACERLKLS